MTDDSDGVTHSPILCGLCRSPISLRIESEPDGEAGCAACDNWAAQDEVRRLAGEYVKDEAALHLNRQMAETARRSKFIQFSGQTVNDQTYRFVIDIKF